MATAPSAAGHRALSSPRPTTGQCEAMSHIRRSDTGTPGSVLGLTLRRLHGDDARARARQRARYTPEEWATRDAAARRREAATKRNKKTKSMVTLPTLNLR